MKREQIKLHAVYLTLIGVIFVVTGAAYFSVTKPLLFSGTRAGDDYDKYDNYDNYDKYDSYDSYDDYDSYDGYGSAGEEYETVYVTEEVPVEKEVMLEPVTIYKDVVEEGYAVDSDGDELVDAIDPDPNVKQQEYFTDSDGDGIPNLYDAYPDEDDFLYIETLDANDNGVLDVYES